MIISDEDDAQKIKDPTVAIPTVRYPERAAGRRPFSPLPDYETSQALAFRDFNESQVTLYKPPPPRRFFDSRVRRAVFASLVVYVFLTLVIGVPIIVNKEHQKEDRYPYNPLTYAFIWPPNKNPGQYTPGNLTNSSSPSQPGIVPICGNWTSLEYFGDSDTPTVFATTERYVSPSGQFSFISNASSSLDINNVQGVFYAGMNPDQTAQQAILSLGMQSSSQDLFHRSSACFAVADNLTGLFLNVPDDLASDDNVLYNITLLFPQSTPCQVDSFTTVLPMFDQQFGPMGNTSFDTISLQGDASMVNVNFLKAKRIQVDISMGPVTGAFYVDTSLFMSTIMAPITADISLFNDPKCPFPTTLDVHTGNSNLTANVTVLAPNAHPPSRPNFVANLRTFSGSLSVDWLHDPTSPPTFLQLYVFNDLGPVSVILDALFGGFFRLSTKQAVASLTQGNASVTDPWNSEQPRTMQVKMNSTAESYGLIGWGSLGSPSDTYPQGEVIVVTSLATAALSFLG